MPLLPKLMPLVMSHLLYMLRYWNDSQTPVFYQIMRRTLRRTTRVPLRTEVRRLTENHPLPLMRGKHRTKSKTPPRVSRRNTTNAPTARLKMKIRPVSEECVNFPTHHSPTVPGALICMSMLISFTLPGLSSLRSVISPNCFCSTKACLL